MKSESIDSVSANIKMLDVHRQYLLERTQVLSAKLRQSISEYSFEEAGRFFVDLVQISQLRQSVEEINLHLSRPHDSVETFLVGSSLLREAYAMLCKSHTESIVYAFGHRFGNLLTIEGLRELELDQSEYVYASANPEFNSKVLAEFDDRGQVLSCYLHAHPGRGSSANWPSNIDLSCQSRLERGRYPTIGAIFSRDGFIRFFSSEKPFRVVVAGKGVERLEATLFKFRAD